MSNGYSALCLKRVTYAPEGHWYLHIFLHPPGGHWSLHIFLHPPFGRVARNERGGQAGDRQSRFRAIDRADSGRSTEPIPGDRQSRFRGNLRPLPGRYRVRPSRREGEDSKFVVLFDVETKARREGEDSRFVSSFEMCRLQSPIPRRSNQRLGPCSSRSHAGEPRPHRLPRPHTTPRSRSRLGLLEHWPNPGRPHQCS